MADGTTKEEGWGDMNMSAVHFYATSNSNGRPLSTKLQTEDSMMMVDVLKSLDRMEQAMALQQKGTEDAKNIVMEQKRLLLMLLSQNAEDTTKVEDTSSDEDYVASADQMPLTTDGDSPKKKKRKRHKQKRRGTYERKIFGSTTFNKWKVPSMVALITVFIASLLAISVVGKGGVGSIGEKSTKASSPSLRKKLNHSPQLNKKVDEVMLAKQQQQELRRSLLDETTGCESNDPTCCGSSELKQSDYRGTLSTTEDGMECEKWDAEWILESKGPLLGQEFPDAGLDDHNYCRNPWEREDRAFCYTKDNQDWGFCNVPNCPPKPTTSPSCMELTVAVLMPSSRGRGSWSIESLNYPDLIWNGVNNNALMDKSVILIEHSNGTNSMNEQICIPPNESFFFRSFDAEWFVVYSGEELVYCGRANQLGRMYEAEFVTSTSVGDGDTSTCELPSLYTDGRRGEGLELAPMRCNQNTGVDIGAKIGDTDWEKTENKECKIIMAEACTKKESFLGFHPIALIARISGKESYLSKGAIEEWKKEISSACDYNQCVFGNDYESEDFLNRTFDADATSCQCSYEVMAHPYLIFDQEDGQYRHDCCQENSRTVSDLEASCECSVKLDCEAGDGGKCHEYARHCCGDDDTNCKCVYHKSACEGYLESGSPTLAYDDCSLAEEYCCADDPGMGGCGCDIYEPLCTDYPTRPEEGIDVCDSAITRCCGTSESCPCDFWTHFVPFGREDEALYRCNQVSIQSYITMAQALERMYRETGGDYWSNNTGWMSSSNFCMWYGITCDDEGSVTEIAMRGNNMTGQFPGDSLGDPHLHKLKLLDLAHNNLSGWLGTTTAYDPDEGRYVNVPRYSEFYDHRVLSFVDLSHNALTGGVDALFTPSLEYVNFSHNNFTSFITFKRFKMSHNTLRTCDLSYNSIQGNAHDILRNMPVNLENFVLSHNMIQGTLPQLESLSEMRRFDMGSNMLNGTLPDFSTAFPNLNELNLSNQKQGDSGGLSGSISARLSNLPFLTTLDLSGNRLGDTIPAALGNFGLLKVLNFSDNVLSKAIPAELGDLAGKLEVFDVSENKLSGTVPSELGQFKEEAFVWLSGNADISTPAPLSLCSLPNFDLIDDIDLCSVERQALKSFSESAKSSEWTDNTNWLDEYANHCSWYGVSCRNGIVTELNLTNNGLPGKLSESIAKLTKLEVLDLSDNGIQGRIPTEVGLLSNLSYLRLSHNAFVQNAPTELTNLTQLKLIQLHGNRLSGTIPELIVHSQSKSSFVADCGVPSVFEDPLVCESCTMCCNSQEDCQPNTNDPIQATFSTYTNFTWVYFVGIIGGSCLLVLVVSYKYRSITTRLSINAIRQRKERTTVNALENFGKNSVYQFLLSNSKSGWAVTLSTMAFQLWVLFVFVRGAVPDPTAKLTALVFTWKCSRGTAECDDKSLLNWEGWAIFGIIMFVHLSADVINGCKLFVRSASQKHSLHTRIRCFFGGMLLNIVTFFTLFASVLYNQAIATSNTEIVANSVVILFIMYIDEYLYKAISAANENWIKRMSRLPESMKEETEQKLQRVESELEQVRQEMETMRDMFEVRIGSTVFKDDGDQCSNDNVSIKSDGGRAAERMKQKDSLRQSIGTTW